MSLIGPAVSTEQLGNIQTTASPVVEYNGVVVLAAVCVNTEQHWQHPEQQEDHVEMGMGLTV